MNPRDDWPVRDGPLADLFAVAAGAPEPDELAGEDAALAAFRANRLDRARRDRERSRTPLVTGARWLTVKGVALCVGALAAGGAAFAATTGTLPVPPSRHAPVGPPTESRAVPASAAPTRPGSHAPSTAPRQPAVQQLCWTFLHTPPSVRDELLDYSREYQTLIAAAGGRTRVEDYCARLVMASPLPGMPPGVPTSVPTSLPTGYPTGIPARPPQPPGHI